MAGLIKEIVRQLDLQFLKLLFYFLFAATVLKWIIIRITAAPIAARPRQNSPDLEKPSLRQRGSIEKIERPFGIWIPSDFKRPAATPYPGWDVHKTPPLPYRPFKWGPYHITMGLKNMLWDDWIELDNRYAEFHATKKQRVEERGAKCNMTAPEAYNAAVELLDELVSYLPQRYPTLFRPTPTGIHNLLTHEIFNTTTCPLPEDPMQICGRLIQDDLALMIERPDGQYYLLAGSILLPGFWRLTDKFGMPLSEIHTSGSVPGFREKLEKPMMSFFRRIQPNSPVVRNNYFIQIDDNLAWSSHLGSEDERFRTQVEGWANDFHSPDVVDKHHYRSERQTLRRLPKTGAVVFTIRTYFEPVKKISEEAGVPGRLASAIRSWGEDSARYKGRGQYEKAVLGYLDEKHREQVAAGLVGENGEEVGGKA